MPERQDIPKPKESIYGIGPYVLYLGQARNEATGALEHETFVYTGGQRADCFMVVRKAPKGFMGDLKPISHRKPNFDEVQGFVEQFFRERDRMESLYIDDAWYDYVYKQEKEVRRVLQKIERIANTDHNFRAHRDVSNLNLGRK